MRDVNNWILYPTNDEIIQLNVCDMNNILHDVYKLPEFVFDIPILELSRDISINIMIMSFKVRLISLYIAYEYTPLKINESVLG